MQKQEGVFVIEVCENCKGHKWNTHHDEAKYKLYATEVESSLKRHCAGAIVHIN